MKWSQKSAERIWKWPVIVITAPVWIPAVGFLLACIKIDRWCAKIAEKLRPSTEPHQWFAWRPVSFSVWTDSYGESAWLETVWRARGRWGETIYAPTRESLEQAQ